MWFGAGFKDETLPAGRDAGFDSRESIKEAFGQIWAS